MLTKLEGKQYYIHISAPVNILKKNSIQFQSVVREGATRTSTSEGPEPVPTRPGNLSTEASS